MVPRYDHSVMGSMDKVMDHPQWGGTWEGRSHATPETSAGGHTAATTRIQPTKLYGAKRTGVIVWHSRRAWTVTASIDTKLASNTRRLSSTQRKIDNAKGNQGGQAGVFAHILNIWGRPSNQQTYKVNHTTTRHQTKTSLQSLPHISKDVCRTVRVDCFLRAEERAQRQHVKLDIKYI